MNKITILVLTLNVLTSFGQSIETIAEKISGKICDCIKDDINSYSDMYPAIEKCYNQGFNKILTILDSTEHKILLEGKNLKTVKNSIIPILGSTCKKVKTILKSELGNAAESAGNNKSEPCPTNFTGEDLKNIEKLNGDIIAFNGLVIQVHSAHNDKPYYEVALEGGNTLWIGSLVKSGFEKEGKILRILGYVSDAGKDVYAEKYNNLNYHILAFCVIEMETKQMSILPGSEGQIKEWLNGNIPDAKK